MKCSCLHLLVLVRAQLNGWFWNHIMHMLLYHILTWIQKDTKKIFLIFVSTRKSADSLSVPAYSFKQLQNLNDFHIFKKYAWFLNDKIKNINKRFHYTHRSVLIEWSLSSEDFLFNVELYLSLLVQLQVWEIKFLKLLLINTYILSLNYFVQSLEQV